MFQRQGSKKQRDKVIESVAVLGSFAALNLSVEKAQIVTVHGIEVLRVAHPKLFFG